MSSELLNHLSHLRPYLLTVEDVAHYLRTDAATVTSWLEAGDLPGYRLPTRWLIAADELADYLRDTRTSSS